MDRFILLNISVKEPVKTGLSYIQGSTIRGAYIRKYITKNNITDDIAVNECYRNKLLSNKIRFSNAYPLVNNKFSIPTPLCFYATKEDGKKLGREKDSISIINESEGNIGEGYIRVNKKEFCFVDKEILKLVSTYRVENLHIRKIKNSETDKGSLFRYTAIDKEQNFYSFIQCSEENEGEIIKTIDNEIVYIGGSKGSGYGRCEIKVDKVLDYNQIKEMQGIFYDNNLNKILKIYFLSDSIIKDKFGQVISHIDTKYIEEKLNIDNVEYIKGSVLTTETTGYNATLRTSLPSMTSIKSGSILTYKYEGELDLKLIKKLEIQGVGYRKEEGYGSIIINPCFSVKSCEFYKRGIPKIKEDINLKRESKKLFTRILNDINNQKITDLLTKIAIEAIDTKTDSFKKKKVVLSLSNSQIGRLISIVNKCENEENDALAKEMLINFRDSLKTNTKNEYLNKSRNSLFNYPLCVDSKNNSSRDYFDELISDKDISDLTGTSIKLNNVSVKGIDLDRLNNFRLKLKLTKEILIYQLRKEEGKDNER